MSNQCDKLEEFFSEWCPQYEYKDEFYKDIPSLYFRSRRDLLREIDRTTQKDGIRYGIYFQIPKNREEWLAINQNKKENIEKMLLVESFWDLFNDFKNDSNN